MHNAVGVQMCSTTLQQLACAVMPDANEVR